MQKFVILNPKGGSGKTTIATNLASHLAVQGGFPTLMDCDPQGSAMRWLQQRPDERPAVHGMAAYERNHLVTRSWRLRVSRNASHLIVDTPAALEVGRYAELTQRADAILVPVLPSDIDIHAVDRCLDNLLRIAQAAHQNDRIGVIANRVNARTGAFRALRQLLTERQVRLVGILRDTHNYTLAAEQGIGIPELPAYRVRRDLDQWDPLLHWLRTRKPSCFAPGGDLRQPEHPGSAEAADVAG